MQVRDFQAEARQRHQPLKDAATALRVASEAPEEDRFDRISEALEQVSAALEVHIGLTEGPDGTHAQLLAAAPRLSNDIRLLAKDHAFIECLTETTSLALQADDPVEEHIARLLERMSRHRLRDRQLVYEAYQVDIGGQA